MSLKAQIKKVPLPPKDFFVAEEIPDTPFVNAYNRKLLDLTCRDVLNYRWNKILKRKLHESIESLSIRSRGPRAVSGISKEQSHFEKNLSNHLQKEAVFLFSSRTQALISLVTSFALETDRLVSFSGSDTPVEDLSLIAGCSYAEINYDDDLQPSYGRDFYFYKQDSEIGDRISSGKSQIKIENIYTKVTGGMILSPPNPLISFDNFLIGSFEEIGFSSMCFLAGELDLIEYIKARTGTVNIESPLPTFVYSYLDEAIGHSLEFQDESKLITEKLNLLCQTIKLTLLDAQIREDQYSLKISIDSYSKAILLKNALIKRGFLIEVKQIKYGKLISAEIVFRLNSLISEQQILAFAEVFSKEYLSLI